MRRPVVAVLRTRPETVLEDYHTLMNLAGYQDVVAKDADTALKINISWHFFFPGSSTTPWQLDGVIRAMKRDGYRSDLIHGCHNRTVVIDAHLGERENKQLPVIQAHGLRNLHIYEGEEWIDIREAVGDLTEKFLCLNEVYPDGFMIPRRFIGENIIHLPTVKTHVFTTMTGAMKNAFGGLLNERRHWTHPVIHETLVDLLMIQQKIHRGVFAVMDGTFAGDGPGPRCMIPQVKNVVLASADQVAIDAVAARMMGMDPLSIKFIRLAHDLGLGCGDPREIDIAGDAEAAGENWHFVGPFRKMTFASRMQHKIYWGPWRKPVEWSLKTVLAPWAYIASVVYHDSFWYPLKAKAAMRDALNSSWGRLFRDWEQTTPTEHGYPVVSGRLAALPLTGFRALVRSIGILGTCLKEAPEFAMRRRRAAPASAAVSSSPMAEFNIRTDAVDVEQIMRQIRTRIREKRGVDYTEEQIQELASVKLEKFLDPKGVRSDLVEQFRRTRGTSPPTLNYMFEDTTLFDSHRWIVRAIRSLLKPLLKLFFNPNMIIHALHEQSRINDLYAKRFDARDELDALYYEVVHNLVLETTRLGIEAKNLKMRVESMSSRLDFDERRARALEGVVQYRPAGAGARDRAREQPTASSTRPSEAGARPMETSARPADAAGPPVAEDGQAGPLAAPRRRRRRRGRRGRGNTPVGEGASASAPTAMTGDPHSGAAEPSDAGLSAEPDDDGPDEDPVPSDQ